MAKTLFVDTNVFLSLYAFSDEDIEQFRKIFVLSQQGEIDFILPKQVVDEFWRNREAKIRESYDRIKSYDRVKIPAVVRDLPAAKAVMSAQNELGKAHSELVDGLLERASKHELSADKLIKEIFEKSTLIETTQEVLDRAKKRVLLGNPPGKSGSYGDAINWECVLTKVDIFDTLHFVSRDKDYASKLHEGSFNEFLDRELSELHVADVEYYSSLKEFIERHFPEVKIEAFLQAAEAVQALEQSGSFSSTHLAITRLNSCEVFSINQVKRLIVAGEENAQVSWILGDDDVFGFFKSLRDSYKDQLGKHFFERLERLVEEEVETEVEFDEIPF